MTNEQQEALVEKLLAEADAAGYSKMSSGEKGIDYRLGKTIRSEDGKRRHYFIEMKLYNLARAYGSNSPRGLTAAVHFEQRDGTYCDLTLGCFKSIAEMEWFFRKFFVSADNSQILTLDESQ